MGRSRDVYGVFQKKTENGWEDICAYESEEHQLFDVLTGNCLNYIGQPSKGLPYGFNEYYGWHGGTRIGNNHSYLTGEEMIHWCEDTHSLRKSGLVTRDFFCDWDGVSEPEYYSQYRNEIVSVPAELADMKEYAHINMIRVRWEVELSHELTIFMEDVKILKAEYGEIRFVFGFD